MRILFILTVLFAAAAPLMVHAQALSCSIPANSIVMHCDGGVCDRGFRVIQQSTGFPCETRPIVEATESLHDQLFNQFLKLGAIGDSTGVFQINFISCTREAVETVPWNDLSVRERDWSGVGADQSEWQIRRRSENITIFGRESGCTLVLDLTAKGSSVEELLSLEQQYGREQRYALLTYIFRMWIVPLLIWPAVTIASLLWFISLNKRKDLQRRQTFLFLVPPAIQLVVFLQMLGPATDVWMGPYKFFFLLPCGLVMIVWLIELLLVWQRVEPILDKLQQERSAADPEESEINTQ